MGEGSPKVPRPKRVPLDVQVAQISKLLTLWPQAPTAVVEWYVRAILGVTMTQACLQTAKEALGLSTPRHTELTLRKKAATEAFVRLQIATFGKGGIKEQQLLTDANRNLKDMFSQDTQHLLVRNWVTDTINEMAEEPLERLFQIASEARLELEKLGALEKDDNQVELL